MSDTNVTINLDSLDSTEVRSEGELIFQKQFKQLVRKIRRKARENETRLDEQAKFGYRRKEQEDESRGIPACFFIDGSRGSGKSTLMRAVRDALLNGKSQQEGESHISLYSLADVDPTELGKGENFFLYLLSRIYQILEEEFAKRDSRDEDAANIRSAMDDLRQMSGGLQVLMDSDEALKKTDNPDFFLENCVDKCADSSRLRRKLCDLLGKVAKIVGKEVFLVTIDDADLNFSKCEDVLEYVRKYMQTPRLIFLFAGDMQLYSHVVRGMHIKCFNAQQLQYDTSHQKHREMMLNRMEEQYLLKIFPADNREKMPTIGELMNEKGTRFFVSESSSVRRNHYREIPFLFYIRHFVFPVYRGRTRRIVATLLSTLSLRSILFLLKNWRSSTQGLRPGSEDFVRVVSDCLQTISSSVLVKHNINYASLDGHNSMILIRALVDYLTRSQLWKTNLDFLPNDGDFDAALLSVYLGSRITATTQKISEKLLYLCTLYPQQYRLTELYAGRFERGEVAPTMRMEEDYSKLGAVACACTAPVVASGANYTKRFGNGVIRLMQDSRNRTEERGGVKRISFAQLARKITDSIQTPQDCLLGMALAHSVCSIQEGNEKSYYLSVYNLILHIAEWLEQGNQFLRSDDFEEGKINAEKRTELREVVKDLLSRSTISATELRENHKNEVVRESEDEEDEKQSYFVVHGMKDQDEHIVDEYVDWLISYATKTSSTPPGMYSSCWSRFMWRCESITKETSLRFSDKEKAPRAGTLMQSYMKAFEEAVATSFSVDGMESNLIYDCVRSFPLWRALMAADSQTSALFKSLNGVNVGALRYQGYVDALEEAERMVNQARSEYEAAEKLFRSGVEEQKKAEDAERSAYNQWQKEKAKAEAMEKNEVDFAEYEHRADQYVTEIRQQIENLWQEIKVGEMSAAADSFPDKDAAVDAELADLQKQLAQKKGALKRARRDESKERIAKEVKQLETLVQARIESRGVKSVPRQNAVEVARAVVKVARERLKKSQSDLKDAVRAWNSAKNSVMNVRKTLHISQQEAKRLEGIWEKKVAELGNIRELQEANRQEMKAAQAAWQKAKTNVQTVRNTDFDI